MRAVILAAGRGTRMADVSRGRPKCLLEFGKRTILDYQIQNLLGAGIDEIAIVVGYEKEQIVEHVAHEHLDSAARIQFLHNRLYRTTNNIYSLGRARNWASGRRFLCLNADVLFHPWILRPLLRASHAVTLAVDPEFREETAKVIIREGRIVALGKKITRAEASGTFANMAAFSARGSTLLFRTIEAMVRAGMVNCFFNDAILRLAAKGTEVGYTETGALPWAEVDDARDVAYAERAVYPALVGAHKGSREAPDGYHAASEVAS